MSLVWTRSRDGEHNGKPIYEYTACAHDREYCIVWAYNGGGTFGFTAARRVGKNFVYLTESHGIQWCKTLKNCKASCERIEAEKSK